MKFEIITRPVVYSTNEITSRRHSRLLEVGVVGIMVCLGCFAALCIVFRFVIETLSLLGNFVIRCMVGMYKLLTCGWQSPVFKP